MTSPSSLPPVPDSASGQAGMIAVATKEIVANADRFGLKWRMVPATVNNFISNGPSTSVILDGDSASMNAVSLIDGPVIIGQRVMTLIVPPSNAYIFARILGNASQAITMENLANSFLTTNSATYTTNVVSGTAADNATLFIAPASGRVQINWSAVGKVNNAANTGRLSAQVRIGEDIGFGTVVSDVTDDTCCAISTTGDSGSTANRLVSGLAPGVTHNVRIYHKLTGTTDTPTARLFTIGKRNLIVIPVP
jgi:hypothetical protein